MSISKCICFVYDHCRLVSVVILLLFTVSLYFIITDLKVDNTLKVWFSEDDKSYQTFLDFQERYGNDDIITVMITYPFKVYEKQAVRDLLSLETALEELVYVERVYSYGSSNFIHSSDTEFSVEKVVTEIPVDLAGQQRIVNRLNTAPKIRDTFISEDERSHKLFIRLEDFKQIELQRDEMVREIRGVIDQFVTNHHIAGIAVLNEALNKAVAKESGLFTFVCYAVLILILALVVRKRRFFIIAILAIIIPMIMTFGLFSIAGYTLNTISMTIPTILMVYALADVVHIINKYLQNAQSEPHLEKKLLVTKTLLYCFKPCFYASLTTMLAYISFIISPLEVLKTTGLFAFFGLGLAFIIVYIIAITGFALFQHPNKEMDWAIARSFERFTKKFTEWIILVTERRKIEVLAIFGILFITSVLLIPKVEVNTYPGEYLDKNTIVRKDSEVIEQTMGPYIPFETIIKSTNNRRVISSNNLNIIDRFQNELIIQSSISDPTSIVDVVKYLNRELGTGDYEIPDSDKLISQLLMIYELDENNQLDELTDIGYSEARITGKVKLLGANDYTRIIENQKSIFSQSNRDERLQLIPQGYMPLYARMVNKIAISLLYSFTGAFVLIGLVMLIFFRSVNLTLMCLATNLIPISSIGIIMYVFHVPLDMGTVMITAIMFGIAVDDTMHLIFTYLNHRKNGICKHQSIDCALRSVSQALLTSSLALVLGFLVFGLSSVSNIQLFGILCAISVLVTLCADLFLLPIIMKISFSTTLFTLKNKKDENFNIHPYAFGPAVE